MTDFAWREELSESFGKVKRPVAEIFAMTKGGQWHALTMYVDSGADIQKIDDVYNVRRK
jgi:hypothetical protein